MKFCIFSFSENLSRKFKFHKNLVRIKGSLHETQYMFFDHFLIISPLFLLRMINVLEEL